MKRMSLIFILLTSFGAALAADAPKLRKLISPKLEQRKIDEVFAFFEKNIPGILKEIESRLPANMDVKRIHEGEVPERLEDIIEHIRGMYEFYQEYHELKQEEPKEAAHLLKIYKLEFKINLMGDAIIKLRDQGEDKNKAAIEAKGKELRAEIKKLFELKLDAQRQELKWMEKEIKQLKRIIQKREKLRDKIIEHQYLRVTGDEEVLEF